MQRSILIPLATVLALAAPGVPTGPADAATPRCQGQPATVVGTHRGYASGTAGPDVIVSNGASSVNGWDGDDLICITGDTGLRRRVHVSADDGDDTVVTSGGNDTKMLLGRGEDTFIGGPNSDYVKDGDLDADVVDTGDGDDIVSSGYQGHDNPDQITLGDGDDGAYLRGTSGTVAGGPGTDTLGLETYGEVGPEPWTLDNTAGTASRLGVTHFTWTAVEDFYLKHLGYGLPMTVIGSDADETFLLDQRGDDAGAVTLDAGGGRDVVAVNAYLEGSVDGGGGRDSIEVDAAYYRAVRVDLRGGEIRCADECDLPTLGFEDAEITGADRTTVLGTGEANRILVNQSCRIRVKGGGGSDHLEIVGYHLTSCGRYDHPETSSRLDGGDGADTLVGGRYDDVLIGGAGRDKADGQEGRDRCSAEIRKGCER